VKDIQTSHSKISTYKLCPKKYKYRYIDRLPVIEHWPHLVKGNFAHDVLEAWTQHIIKNVDPTEAMQQSFIEIKRQKKYTDLHIEKYTEEIKPWLRGFLKRYQQNKFIPLAAEQKVGFKYRNIIVIGRIDRIDHIDDRTIKIIDYKSTKDPKYLTNFQLGIYHMAVKYGELKAQYGSKTIQTAYVLLRHDMKEAPYEFSVPDLDACLDEIETTVHQIQPDTTWEAHPSRMCQYCDYFIPCTKERESVDAWW
jgi:RecB family exonuclease